MGREIALQRPSLPILESPAYFPQGEINLSLCDEVLRRVGKKNLVWAMGYGSQVSGDAGKRSMYDVMVVVDDITEFHKRGILFHPFDYAQPHLTEWHAFLNRWGFNFYHSEFKMADKKHKLKLAVISKEDFIRGCSGALGDQGGAFGMYVAGRVQKAALSPLYKRTEEDATIIETAINTARVHGVWYALGFIWY